MSDSTPCEAHGRTEPNPCDWLSYFLSLQPTHLPLLYRDSNVASYEIALIRALTNHVRVASEPINSRA